MGKMASFVLLRNIPVVLRLGFRTSWFAKHVDVIRHIRQHNNTHTHTHPPARTHARTQSARMTRWENKIPQMSAGHPKKKKKRRTHKEQESAHTSSFCQHSAVCTSHTSVRRNLSVRLAHVWSEEERPNTQRPLEDVWRHGLFLSTGFTPYRIGEGGWLGVSFLYSSREKYIYEYIYIYIYTSLVKIVSFNLLR